MKKSKKFPFAINFRIAVFCLIFLSVILSLAVIIPRQTVSAKRSLEDTQPNGSVASNETKPTTEPANNDTCNARSSPNSKKVFDGYSSNPVSLLNLRTLDGLWQFVEEYTTQNRSERVIVPSAYKVVKLNRDILKWTLNRAPLEFTESAGLNQVTMTLPLPDGSFGTFRIEGSPIMEKELAEKFPQIKTYTGQGIDDPTATVRFDWTPDGFHAMILSETDTIYIDPYAKGDTENYVTYYKKDYLRDREPSHCLVQGRKNTSSRTPESIAIAFSNGATLRTYRLALAATGEYTNFFRQSGDTDQQAKERAFSAMTTTMNRVNGIYQRELAIRMIFVANQMNIIHTDPNTDPYPSTSISSLISQNQTSLDSVIGSANYDIGHVVGKVTSGAGGGASLAVVCVNGSKARGATTSGNPVGDAFDVDFVAHEMGHQFGADHTFNGSRGSCDGNGNGSLAYEPGSGSTIMAYAGICACQDLQPHSDSYFHTASVNQIINFINRPTSCAAQMATGNTPPTVDAGQNYTIPKRTTFTLTATGSDGNGDSLTYSWEEFDLNSFGSPPDTDEDGRARPIFRSFTPTSNPSRTFPSLSDLQANGFTLGESLPTITRTMNFQATARDNRAGGGGIATDLMQVNVNGNSGPFIVTQPNANLTWTIGTNQTIVWNVADTNAAPVNAANVRILLSTDSGLTFPNILIANTPNDGSETITIPNLPTTAGRIKIEAIGNIFFDISNVDFTIAAGNCNFGLDSISQTFANVGGSGSVTVTTNPGCSWTAASFAPWITITSPNNGAGVGTVTFTIAANPDPYRTGKMSVAGQTLTITQYSHGGVLDNSFAEYCGISPFGGDGFNDQLNDLLILPDGKIIAVGTTETSTFRDFQLVRYNPNGSFDTSFGSDGIIRTDFNGQADFARKILRQNDGKLIVLGETFNGPTPFYDFALVRYNPNGSLDTTFGNNGKVSTDFNNRSDTAYSGVILSDGKIIVIGASFGIGLALARYNSDGSLDATFGTGGKVVTPFSDFDSAYDMALQADGKIVLVGDGRVSVQVTDTFDFKLARYNSNGSLDTTFGTGGKVTTDFGGRTDQANSVIIKDDKIIVAGESYMNFPNSDFALARYNNNGSLDTTFGTGGKVLTDFQGGFDRGSEITLQSDGKIVVVGTATINGTGQDFGIARYDTNGNLDATFGNGGKVTTQLPELLTNNASSIAFQSDNKFIVGGSNGSSGSDRFFALARYESGLPLIVVQPTIKYPFDFDGDRRSDIAVFRPDNGAWYLLRSTLGFTGLQFGINSDLIAPGDFDGDGRADVSVFRPLTGSWYRLNSSNGAFAAVQFGQNGDLPRPADFDGDGKDDICVFRPSSGSWYRLNSSNGQFAAVQFGQNGDVPLIADFDGDGKSDIAVFRPSSGAWYWLNSSNGQFNAVQFGVSSDIPSVGDFDGDGKSDISVFRPATGSWYRLNSGNGQFAAVQFGVNGDIPTVGDFDGDGKSDVAVFRPSSGIWYLLQSQSGFTGVQFGISSDKPIPSAFLP